MSTHHLPTSSMRTAVWGAMLAIVSASSAGGQVPAAELDCDACHGSLELLRQHTETLDEARALRVPVSTVAGSAHGDLSCSECHEGVTRYPHGDITTQGCAACHEDQAAPWQEGIHARDDHAACVDCHGTHAVADTAFLAKAEGRKAVQAACSACHFEPLLPPSDPHAAEASCAACHAPHRTLPPTDPRDGLHPQNQGATCGACHDSLFVAWSADAHGAATARLAAEGGGETAEDLEIHLEPPTCTGCHGAHGMLTPRAEGFDRAMSERCSHCHEAYEESFADSYHGQATELGSERAAACHDCHGGHEILAADDPASTVSEARLLETCRTCHEDAGPAFALFEPHADHHDRERYPYAYWSYHLMTALLIGTFTFFGIHTLLWLARLSLDALKGNATTHHGGDAR